jgi:hypothetical protein
VAYITNNNDITVEFSVTQNEDFSSEVTVTESPIESGGNIADHGEAQPEDVSISGIVVGTDAADKLQLLRKLRDEIQIVDYVGRSAEYGLLIQSFSHSHPGEISNGFSFSIKFVFANISYSQDFILPEETTLAIQQIAAQLQEEANAGTQQLKSKERYSTSTVMVTDVTRDEIYLYTRGDISPSYIDINKSSLPYRVKIKIEDYECSIRFDCNSTGDYFTGDLTIGKKEIAVGEALTYGRPLFTAAGFEKTYLVPFDISQRAGVCNWETLGGYVFLYAFDTTDVKEAAEKREAEAKEAADAAKKAADEAKKEANKKK